MSGSQPSFARTRAARDAWEELGRRNELLPADHFSDRLAPDSAYYDHSCGWSTPEPEQRGRTSPALSDVVDARCCGWKRPPRGEELYDAFRNERPTPRQRALLRTWIVEATIGQLIEAWAQQAYSDRQLAESIHRIGLHQADDPRAAERIRFLKQPRDTLIERRQRESHCLTGPVTRRPSLPHNSCYRRRRRCRRSVQEHDRSWWPRWRIGISRARQPRSG